MSANSEREFPSEYEDDYDEERAEQFAPEIAEDDPRRDPVPGEAPSRRAAAKSRRPAARTGADTPRITKRMKDEAQEEIESFLLLGAAMWAMQAPPCGESLEQATPKAAEILTRIVARNPKWLMAAREGSLILDLIALAGTLLPTAKVAYAFYSAPKGGDDRGVEFDPGRFPAYDGSGISR